MLAGPGWDGEVPVGVELVRSPVRVVNILYRIGIKGPDEYDIVNALQDETLVVPLSRWAAGDIDAAPSNPSDPVPAYRDVIAYGTGTSGADQRIPGFFAMLQDALDANAPYTEWDKSFVDDVHAELGVMPGGNFCLLYTSDAADD